MAFLTLAACAGIAWQQVTYWRDTESVFRRALAVTDGNWVAHNGLGSALVRSGDTGGAIAELRAAISIAPDSPEAQANLGTALLQTNQPTEAMACLTFAVQRRPDEPTFRVSLGSALHGGVEVEAFRQGVPSVLRSPAPPL
jgi:Flp pilus assembly protein TadD